MTEMMDFLTGVILFCMLCGLGLFGATRRMKNATEAIIDYLKQHNATGPDHAAALPFEPPVFFRKGLRDFRPRALEALLRGGIIAEKEAGRYYLNTIRSGE